MSVSFHGEEEVPEPRKKLILYLKMANFSAHGALLLCSSAASFPGKKRRFGLETLLKNVELNCTKIASRVH